MSKGQREMTYEELKYAYMKKVQRVHELEDAVESYKMAEEQNKRYREALEKIARINIDQGTVTVSEVHAVLTARKALEVVSDE